MLKQEYNEEKMPLSEALKLAIKVLNKTLDVTKLTKDKGKVCQKYYAIWFAGFIGTCRYYSVVEMATLTRKGDKTEICILPDSKVESIINVCEEEAKDQRSSKSKESSASTSK